MSDQSNKLELDLNFLNTEELKPEASEEKHSLSKEPLIQDVVVPEKVRPWIRYWARYFDVFIFAFIFAFICVFIAPSVLKVPEIIFTMISYFLWMFIESVFLATWGTTFGKWLLNIKISTKDGKPDFASALNRSFSVWLKGNAMALPFIYLFTNITSYNHLRNEGITTWDKDGGFTVSHKKIGFFRILLAIIIGIISLWFIILSKQ